MAKLEQFHLAVRCASVQEHLGRELTGRELREIIDFHACDIEDRRAAVKNGRQANLSLLLFGLRDPDEGVKISAALALGEKRDPKAVAPLIETLSNKSMWDANAIIPAAARDALAMLRNEAAEAAIALCNHPDPDVRKHVIAVLGKLPTPGTTEALCTVLAGDPEEHIRARAAAALEKRFERTAEQAFRNALTNDTHAPMRALAVRILCNVFPLRAETPLISALKDEERIVRAMAAVYLGYVGGHRSAGPLLARLLDQDEDAFVRKRSYESIIQIGTPALLPLLRALVDPRMHRNRQAGMVKDLLVFIATKKLADFLSYEPFTIRLRPLNLKHTTTFWPVITNNEKVRIILGKTAHVSHYRLNTIHDLVSQDYKIRRFMRAVVDESGRHVEVPMAVPMGFIYADPLLTVLRSDSDESIREAAAETLEKIANPRLTEPLKEAFLHDESDAVRYAAGHALVASAGYDAVEFLVELLMDQEEDTRVRRQAMELLGLTRSPDAAIPILRFLLEDTPQDVREKAAQALVFVGAPAFEPVLTALTDTAPTSPVRDNPEVRAVLIKVLGTINPFRALPVLMELFSDRDLLVQQTLLFIIANKAGSGAVESLKEALLGDTCATFRCPIETTLITIGQQAFDPLAELLVPTDPESVVYKNTLAARKIISVLVAIDRRRAVDELIRLLTPADPTIRPGQPATVYLVPPEAVRVEAYWWLAQIGDTKALPLVNLRRQLEHISRWDMTDAQRWVLEAYRRLRVIEHQNRMLLKTAL